MVRWPVGLLFTLLCVLGDPTARDSVGVATCLRRQPQGVTTLDLAKVLVKRFSRTELGGVQDFAGGKYEIFLKTRAAVARFLEDPDIEIKGTKVAFEYRGTSTTLVRVFGYSNEHHDVDIAKALQPLGKIINITREALPGMPTVWTGIRRIKMEMKTPVPNFLEVVDTTVQCEYHGVSRVCRRCGDEGHMGTACETAQCERCGAFGHETCEAPCVKCGGYHSISKCKKKTFAVVVCGNDEDVRAEEWEQPPTTELPTPPSFPNTVPVEAGQQAPVHTPDSEREASTSAEQHPACNNLPVDPPETTPGSGSADESDMEAACVSNKRKRSSKRNGQLTQKTGSKALSKSSDDAPVTKRALLKQPASSSSSESDTDDGSHDPCHFCGSTTCDCSMVSDAEYESTSPPSSPAVAEKTHASNKK